MNAYGYTATPIQTVPIPDGAAPQEVTPETVLENLVRLVKATISPEPTAFPVVLLIHYGLLAGVLVAGVAVGRRWGRS